MAALTTTLWENYNTMSISENWRRIMAEIENAASHPVTVMAVTKQRDENQIRQIIAAGAHVLGENRIEETQMKWFQSSLRDEFSDIEVHMIGHIQSRKSRDAITYFDMIQSVDRMKIVRTLNERCKEENRTSCDVLIEINAAGEDQKWGVAPEKAEELAIAVCETAHLNLKGVMTMAPYTHDEKILHECFSATRKCAEKLAQHVGEEHMSVLSMGMSNDYLIAVEEGSTLVRIGSALFEND